MSAVIISCVPVLAYIVIVEVLQSPDTKKKVLQGVEIDVIADSRIGREFELFVTADLFCQIKPVKVNVS